MTGVMLSLPGFFKTGVVMLRMTVSIPVRVSFDSPANAGQAAQDDDQHCGVFKRS
jgi:hypothetical protein